MKVKVNGVSINCEISGQGLPLFLVHGFGGDHTYWEPQVEAFCSRYRVITYDQRGSGKSELKRDTFSITELRDDLHQLMLALDACPAFLVGFSQGGAISMMTAAAYPDTVKGLVMHDASTDTAYSSPELLQQQKEQGEMMIEIIRKSGVGAFADMFVTMNFSPGLRDRKPEVWNRYHAMLRRNRAESVIANMKGGIDTPPPPYDLGRIKCPVLFVHGELDVMIPADKRKRSQESIPGSKLVVLPGAGHASAAEMPDEFNRTVLEFLDSIKQTRKKQR